MKNLNFEKLETITMTNLNFEKPELWTNLNFEKTWNSGKTQTLEKFKLWKT